MRKLKGGNKNKGTTRDHCKNKEGVLQSKTRGKISTIVRKVELSTGCASPFKSRIVHAPKCRTCRAPLQRDVQNTMGIRGTPE